MTKFSKLSKALQKLKEGKRPLTELTGMVGPRALDATMARNEKHKKKNDKKVRATSKARPKR